MQNTVVTKLGWLMHMEILDSAEVMWPTKKCGHKISHTGTICCNAGEITTAIARSPIENSESCCYPDL